MALISPYTNYETTINSTTLMQPENLYYMREAQNILAKKKLIKGHIILKLKKKVMYPVSTTHCLEVCRKPLITTAVPMASTSIVSTCYPYQVDYKYPLTLTEWDPMNTPLFMVPSVPVIIPSASPIFAPSICPFAGTVIQPVLTPMVPQSFVQDDVTSISNYVNDNNFSTEQIDGVMALTNEQTYYMQEKTAAIVINEEIINLGDIENQSDPLELYLSLPKELFPTAKMLAIDPNPIIDEFCKMPNLQRHAPWLLDLEFGIPRTLITRPIPIYNVKFNSINCKNTPDAIHPGFESCDPDFKKVLLFYYDCIVSAWYRGYMILNCDTSVENFQSWLLLPMQVLGMCWP